MEHETNQKNHGSCCHHHSSAPKKPLPQNASTLIFTCPMHPEVRQLGPGDCPECGMALEQEDVTVDNSENPELVDFTRRFWIGTIFTLPLFIIEMLHHLFHLSLDLGGGEKWLQLILASPVVLWCGKPFFERGFKSFKTLKFNMFTLITIGAGSAFIYSVIALIFGASFPESLQSAHGEVPLYFEAAAVIITLVLLGQVLELKARSKTGSAIKELIGLSPKNALVLRDGKELELPVDELIKGDKIKIIPGAKIPVDGKVIEGKSHVDEAMISGEPMPVEKIHGDAVLGGTVNGKGMIIIEAEKVGKDTLLAQIIDLVSKAQRSRAPIQSLADKVSAWFVPVVATIALATFCIWFFTLDDAPLTHALTAAVSVLIIACPCALGLATPLSVMVGIGRAAKEGVLIKNAVALEALEKAKVLVVDKTGTLTEGKPSVSEIVTAEGISTENLLSVAAALEGNSEHPLAKAIIHYCDEKNIEKLTINNFLSLTGEGVQGIITDKKYSAGNEILMKKLSVDIELYRETIDRLRKTGATVIFISQESKFLGLIAIADRLKASTPAAINSLHAKGIEVIMVSGDHQLTADFVAQQLKIKRVHAGVMPAGKEEIIRNLQKEGKIVAMAGDGINDAPALSAADVGIAMGTGTDIAIESSAITLVKGDLNSIAKALSLSINTMKNIRQNLFLAFVYNVAGIPLAAGILFPFTGTLISPGLAAAAMSLSSVSVILNALRLNKISLNT